MNGSCGRLDCRSGFFYFEKATPKEDNADGFRRVLTEPYPSVEPNIYDNVDSMEVSLSCDEGTIYYTTDCSIPTEESAQYTGPITISENTIIRAVAISDTACRSRVNTLSYIINQNRTLPIVSIVTDDYGDFQYMYNTMDKNLEVSGNMTFFKDGEKIF